MSKVALHLADQTAAEKVALASAVVTAMTGNPSFPAPDVPLADLGQRATDLETAGQRSKAAYQAWLTAASAEDDAERALDGALRGEARYVERASQGDETILKGAGFQVAAAPVRHAGTLPAPTRFAATLGDRAGEIDAQWDRLAGARAYQVATAPASEGPWTIALACTKSKATLEGLASGQKLWMRVAALSAQGLGAWTAPLEAMAG